MDDQHSFSFYIPTKGTGRRFTIEEHKRPRKKYSCYKKIYYMVSDSASNMTRGNVDIAKLKIKAHYGMTPLEGVGQLESNTPPAPTKTR